MAEEEEEEEEEYYFFEEEDVPPAYPEVERIKRQLLACSSTFFGAIAAGICSNILINEFMEYRLTLGWHFDYIFWHPLFGDVPGILVVIPLLYFLGRRFTLITSQLFFLVTLIAKEYYHEKQTSFSHRLALPEEFMCWTVLHSCVRAQVTVMIVYVVEVTQPSYRGPFLAAFFPLFTIGLYVGRFVLHKSRTLVYALIAQTCSFLLALLASESPYWEALKGKGERARVTFRHLRAGDDHADELTALLERASPNAKAPPLLVAFGSALAKMVFLFMGTDSVCRVFLTQLTSPLNFFLYDNTFEHEIFTSDESPRTMYMYPIFGSLLCLLVIPFVGRRILYLVSILATFLIFCVRKKLITFDMEAARTRSAELCYFAGHMGAMQVALLVSGEIFPVRVREFGVAICELMRFGLQYADLCWADGGPQWNDYSTVRLSLIPLGILLTFIFLPETRNKTLIETETAGAKMVPVFLGTSEISEDAEFKEEGEEVAGEEEA